MFRLIEAISYMFCGAAVAHLADHQYVRCAIFGVIAFILLALVTRIERARKWEGG